MTTDSYLRRPFSDFEVTPITTNGIVTDFSVRHIEGTRATEAQAPKAESAKGRSIGGIKGEMRRSHQNIPARARAG